MKFNFDKQHFKLVENFFLSSLLLICISCSSTDQIANYASDANFDAGSYINPKSYGYDLNIETDNNEEADPSFSPISLEANLRYVQRLVKYPRRARMSGAEGTVILQICVDSTGTVQNIDVIQSPSLLLTESSVQNVMSVEFNPAMLNGEPVNSFVRCSFAFRMR